MEKFETIFKRNESRFKRIVLSDEVINKINDFVKRLVEKKKSEEHHADDNRSEIKRFTTGLLGEAAIEQYLKIKSIDWSIGDSKKYHKPDLKKIGLDVGIKTVEYGRFPIIFKKSYSSEIINIKVSSNEVLICGLANVDILNKYQDDNLILDDKLRARGTKSGFYGFDNLLQFNSLEKLKERLNG